MLNLKEVCKLKDVETCLKPTELYTVSLATGSKAAWFLPSSGLHSSLTTFGTGDRRGNPTVLFLSATGYLDTQFSYLILDHLISFDGMFSKMIQSTGHFESFGSC